MKSTKEVLADLYERREIYLAEQKKKKNKIIRLAGTGMAAALILVSGILIWQKNRQVNKPDNSVAIQIAMKAYAVGGESDGSGIVHTVELDEYKERTNESVPQNISVDYEGKTLSGTLIDSVKCAGLPLYIDTYKYDNGRFSVVSGTDKICGILFNDKVLKLRDGEVTPKKTEEEAGQYFKEYAAKYITLDGNEEIKVSFEGNMWSCFLNKKVNGVYSPEYFNMVFNDDGEIISISYVNIDEFLKAVNVSLQDDISESVTILTSETAEKALDEKVKQVYQSVKDKKNFGTTVVYKRFAVLSDGRIGLEYTVTAEYVTEEKNGIASVGGDRTVILITR